MSELPSSRFLDSGSLESTLVSLIRDNTSLPVALTGCLDEISTDFAAQEAAATRLRVQLAEAEKNIDSLKRLSQLASAFSAPIRRLPSELLVEIFRQHWVEFDETYDTIDVATFDPIHAGAPKPLVSLALGPLLTLAQVCSRWYKLVMNTSALWAELHLDATIWDTRKAEEKVLDLVVEGLRRSRDAPLYVSIIYENSYRPPFIASPALALLVSTSHRWRSARLWCHLEDVPSFERGLPHLETLQIRLGIEEWEDDVVDRLPAMPRLRTMAYDDVAGIHKMPLEQLNYIRIQQIPWSQLGALAAILPRLHGAVELAIDFSEEHADEYTPILPPLVCDVEDFCISSGTLNTELCLEAATRGIMLNLTAPRLRSLTIGFDLDGEGLLRWPHDAFISFAKRSNLHACLVRLDLAHARIQACELAEVLHHLGALQCLEFGDGAKEEGTALDVALLQELSEVTSDALKLVPHLREVWYMSHLTFDHQVFLVFVEARASRVPSFQFTLQWAESAYGTPEKVFTPEALERFSALQKDPRPTVIFEVFPLDPPIASEVIEGAAVTT
ncbi:F-box domain-containing protein [Mycena kentingensis (nom. inval.)]|nr:F-box domain-containing protein [Mycena kentingensis (nom. inval.)]